MLLSHAAFGGLSLSLLAMATAMAAEPTPPLAEQLAELQRQNAELAQRLGALEQLTAQASRSEAGPFRLIDLSLDILMSAGGSTASDAEIGELQGGGHDPQRRGFTFQGAELSLAGAVDPYFTAEMHVVFARDEPSGETIIELEEAFARSSSLPYGFELKAGQYLTEFGRFNPTHPHSWSFIDQPIILGRVFGGDGQRAPGARMLCSLPTPWVSEVIINTQNADGENCSAFLGAPDEGADGHDHGGAVGGYHPAERDNGPHLLYSARWANAWDIDDTMVKFGASAATGPNAGGENTKTSIWGADLAAKWKPSGGERGWPFVTAEAEFIERRYGVDAIDATGSGLDDTLGTGDDTFSRAPAGTLVDRGFVLQAVWGFYPGWSAGLRYEFVTGTGESIHIEEDAGGGEEIHMEGRQADPDRCDRQRWSPMLAWQPSEFTHFRLQYNYDRSDAMADSAHSVWLGAEFLIGAHPAHTF